MTLIGPEAGTALEQARLISVGAAVGVVLSSRARAAVAVPETKSGSKRRLFSVAVVVALILLAAGATLRAADSAADLDAVFHRPPEPARPWVYWYWMNAAVSRQGITADLTAMKQAGLEGAYLMSIQGPGNPPLVSPPVVQLSPLWWDDMKFAFSEADRLGIKLALHDCDGWATAGGPWITPEYSMQKVVWTETPVEGGGLIDTLLPQPDAVLDYYRDIAVFALPSATASRQPEPLVTTNVVGEKPQSLVDPRTTTLFRSDDPCWIQFAYPAPFTCRSITVFLPPAPNGYQANVYQANRLIFEASDDGSEFRRITRLTPPRHGWQDGDAGITHAIPATTARFFRFIYDPSGSEPGAEDLDSAKWKPSLKLRALVLSSEPRIDDFEGKSGAAWRISARTTPAQVSSADCTPLHQVIDLTSRVDAVGRLKWHAPVGHWTILRIGHTSTGMRNEYGGGGRGLECDKFDPAVVKFQYEHWFGEAVRRVGPDLARRVLKIFHVDSWECGSQNWSPVFRDEFKRRRGYDPVPYLPVMAGVPIESVEVSERFLHDVRTTIAELIVDNFYGTMAALAHAQGCEFSAESVAPTMVSDGMAHFANVDLPMGEFWFRSPGNDKLNDVLDAASGARVYGRTIAQAEAFTERVLAWDESPAILKTLQDRNYGFGINRFVFHVFAENPFLGRRPGVTLGGVGLFFQRDQTWWQLAHAWVEYTARCQALLQSGHAVADAAVFTGEDIPRRAVLPWHLARTLPHLVDDPAAVMAGRRRSTIMEPADWVDPLHGYSYDSINRDALLRLAKIRNRELVLPGGARYRVLVVPAATASDPNADAMTPEVAARLRDFAAAGLTLILGTRPEHGTDLHDYPRTEAELAKTVAQLWPSGTPANGETRAFGKGRVVVGPFGGDSLASLGLPPDLIAAEREPAPTRDGNTPTVPPRPVRIAWTHRAGDGWDLYFVANQKDEPRDLTFSFRVTGRVPELWDPITGLQRIAETFRAESGRTELPLHLPANGSVFVVFRRAGPNEGEGDAVNGAELPITREMDGPWQVTFDRSLGGPAVPVTFTQLASWTTRPEPSVRNYSGMATYARPFEWRGAGPKLQHVWLDLGVVRDIARVKVNGIDCGVAWTSPFRVDIGRAVRDGPNQLEIAVTNTWFNRLAGDQSLPQSRRITWTTAPDRTTGKPLLDAGLLGPVTIRTE